MADQGDRPTDHHDGRPTTDRGPVSLEEAAERLGVTPNAVRQRLKRGTLGGHKTPAGWAVVWPPTRATDRPTDQGGAIDAAWSPTDRPTGDHRPTDQEATDHRPTDRRPTAGRPWPTTASDHRPTDQEATDHRPTDQPSAAVSAAARSQLAAIWDEWLAPLTARNEALARENGELRAERDAAAGERDRLRAERDSDRVLADRLVDLLQAERDEARARVAELEAATEVLAGAAAGPNGHGGGLQALWSRIRERR